MDLRNKPIERGHLFGICSSLGFDPNKVTEITMTPNTVTVSYTSGKTIITASIPVRKD